MSQCRDDRRHVAGFGEACTKADREMNRAYAEVRDVLSAKDRQRLEGAKRAWLNTGMRPMRRSVISRRSAPLPFQYMRLA